MRLVAISLAFLAASCTGSASERIGVLEAKLAELEREQALLTSADESIKVRLTLAENLLAINDRPRTGVFAPGDTRFQSIYTDVGLFLVSLKDVRPYANGYKATFNLGNPASMAFADVEIEIRWGPARPQAGFGDPKEYEEWQKKFVTSKQTVDRRLLGGSWNPVDIVLTPAAAEDVGRIEIVSIKSDSVFLSAR